MPKKGDYQNECCQHRGGIVVYRLKDTLREDCLTLTHAIEFNFANKWAESIGQFLHYSELTPKRVGIALTMITNKDKRHLVSPKKFINY